MKGNQIRKENLLELNEEESAESLYAELTSEQAALKASAGKTTRGYVDKEAVKKEIIRMTRNGMIRYGLLLSIVEMTTLGSIIVFKFMIDFL